MAINQSQIEKPVSLARAYGATRLILFGSALESPAAIVDPDHSISYDDGAAAAYFTRHSRK